MKQALTLHEMAIGHHEMFTSYRQAGFTEEQAMRLIAAFLSGAGQGSS